MPAGQDNAGRRRDTSPPAQGSLPLEPSQISGPLDAEDLEQLETFANTHDDDGSIESRLDGLIGLESEPGLADKLAERGSRRGGPKLAPTEQRRPGEDRRKNVIDTRPSGLERRRGPGRRLPDFVKAAEEGEMNAEQFLFLRAIETFKAVNNKHYPNWTDVLEVIRLLGYRKVQGNELSLNGVDDWTERADAAANVRVREGITHKRRSA
ncbi:MAG: hypothetical protein AAGB48_01405 [Planctomycetota bacterium]